MEELKPCPFCGGKPTFESESYRYGGGDLFLYYNVDVVCNGCGVRMTVENPSACDGCVPEEYALDFAIEAWNTRHERTCKNESDYSEWVCSECQCWIPLDTSEDAIKNGSKWNYCPHCKARIEGD